MASLILFSPTSSSPRHRDISNWTFLTVSIQPVFLPPAYPPFSVQLSLAQSGLHVSMKWGLGVEARVFRARFTRMLAVQATQYLVRVCSFTVT